MKQEIKIKKVKISYTIKVILEQDLCIDSIPK